MVNKDTGLPTETTDPDPSRDDIRRRSEEVIDQRTDDLTTAEERDLVTGFDKLCRVFGLARWELLTLLEELFDDEDFERSGNP